MSPVPLVVARLAVVRTPVRVLHSAHAQVPLTKREGRRDPQANWQIVGVRSAVR